MNDCCCPPSTSDVSSEKTNQRICPHNGSQGKPVQLITLKSLLKPAALEQLNPQESYSFCTSLDCPVVYFSPTGQTFTTTDMKVQVFQKDLGEEVPVCYCFGWSRQKIRNEIELVGTSHAVATITVHIKAKRCGCEVNNPQGFCCLANVRQVVTQAHSIAC
ncbi:putative iron-sulfur cluster-binding metallochaperone [Fischerella thermalis]|uniref:putative iron-sulfur cluster-binding metallochaperone n=1 Tax=Fischerella thermalis TaxID=372787 RepID=UPI001A0C5D93|nr:(2Fe-2S)-binding protein [Fischerella thermalis]MBF1989848.1 (2Fe-2S)-binding protein [Fischerella thermalis M58_A2018_009]MBF2061151.1 (2Fe-2S)-binding protein [Fischerella thermalis M66_A2018_004]MBF2069991.1 (2Fe-2S)-binding protein [Fischerella thermalis M48_A2018_028]